MEEKKKKEKGTKPRPQRPQWGQELGEFCKTKAYGNTEWFKIFNFDRERYWKDPAYKEDLLQKINNYIEPTENSSYKERVLSGVKYQCVEYARRFMILNQDCTLQDIDFAWQIFDINEVDDLIEKGKKLEFKGYKNGETEEIPKPGDYLIFAKSENQFPGHIAVVTSINYNANPPSIDIAEQNYHYRFWPCKDYSRRLLVEKRQGKFYITNKQVDKQYPKVLEHTDSEDSDEEGIIGFKRVERPIKYINSQQ